MTARQIELNKKYAWLIKLNEKEAQAKPQGPSFDSLRRDILSKDGKFNRAGILKLAWFEVKKFKRTLSEALKYVWEMAKSQMKLNTEDRTGWTKFS